MTVTKDGRTSPIRVILCDDNEVVRNSLSLALSYKPGIELVRQCVSAEELLDAVDLGPDVILLDVNLPGIDGLEGLRILRERGVATPVLILSGDLRHERSAIDAGAAGFFYKGTTEIADLVEQIRRASGA